jgi:hypothetical protein
LLSTYFFAQPTPAVLGGYLVLTCFVLVLVFFLIVLVESVTLQLLKWGNFKQSYLAALIANFCSVPAAFLLLALVTKIGLWAIGISWIASVLVEAFVLSRLKRARTRQNALAALLINLASFLILILPAFQFAR